MEIEISICILFCVLDFNCSSFVWSLYGFLVKMIVLYTNKVSFPSCGHYFFTTFCSEKCVYLLLWDSFCLGSEDPFPVKDTRWLKNQVIIWDSAGLILLVTCWVLWQSALACLLALQPVYLVLTQLLHSDLHPEPQCYVLEKFLWEVSSYINWWAYSLHAYVDFTCSYIYYLSYSHHSLLS